MRVVPSPTPGSPSGAGAHFSPLESVAIALGRFINERATPKAVQSAFVRTIGQAWVYGVIKNLLHIEGLERVRQLAPDRGVLLCANHRSFFDQYVITAVLARETRLAREIFFPVRSNFFYESVAGMAVNFFIGAYSMYPPIFRDPARAALNKDAVEKLARVLERRGVLVGMHPEGKRGDGPDPYALLPAQPGIGQLIMRARPTVLPVFISGLTNDFLAQVRENFQAPRPGGQRIVIVFGDPPDLGELLAGKPRPAQYKRVADRVLEEIRLLGERERAARARLA